MKPRCTKCKHGKKPATSEVCIECMAHRGDERPNFKPVEMLGSTDGPAHDVVD